MDTAVSYEVPAGMADLPCTFTRRRTVLGDRGTGLQAIGQRTLYFANPSLTFFNRDLIEVTGGPDGVQVPQVLEVVSIAKPRGHHVELLVEEFAGAVPEVGS